MGVWDLYCVICGAVCDRGGYTDEDDNDIEHIVFKQKYAWLDKIFILLEHNDLVVSGEVNLGNSTLTSKNYPIVETIRESTKKIPFGVPCHKACHQLLKKYLKYNLKLSDIDKKLNWGGVTMLKWGIMKRYHSQFFDFHRLIDDNNEWLIESPLKNTKNRERILKLWKPIISKSSIRSISRSRSKSRSERKSPAESATCFKVGTKRKGLDGNMWQIRKSGKSQRWVKCG
uniref:Uncharacterized protein n=1 Tax=viral metagenome TaxID=1070528 RepID=A0A6C0LJH8_9ZZZZ